MASVIDFGARKKEALRTIFGSKNFKKHYVEKMRQVQSELMQYASPAMQDSRGLYEQTVRQMYRHILRYEEQSDKLKSIFAALTSSYRLILLNDNAKELEEAHIALLNALHQSMTADSDNWTDVEAKAEKLMSCLLKYNGAADVEQLFSKEA